MAASEDESHVLVASLLQSYDALVQAAQEELHLTDKPSYSWIPATMLSPLALISIAVKPKHGQKEDRSKWTMCLRPRTGNIYNTIIGSTGFTEGIHYWEVTLRAVVTPIAVGVVFPSDEAQLNISNMTGLLGETRNDLLFSNAIDVRVENCSTHRGMDCGISGRFMSSQALPMPVGSCRLGFLLDLIRLELRLYVLSIGDASNTPKYDYLIATLQNGRKYYPAFSLNTDSHLSLDTNPAIPSTIIAYKEKMDNMITLLRQIRTTLDTAEKLVQTNTAEYHQLKERYQHLSKLLNTL
jgi:hypothetical protein